MGQCIRLQFEMRDSFNLDWHFGPGLFIASLNLSSKPILLDSEYGFSLLNISSFLTKNRLTF